MKKILLLVAFGVFMISCNSTGINGNYFPQFGSGPEVGVGEVIVEFRYGGYPLNNLIILEDLGQGPSVQTFPAIGNGTKVRIWRRSHLVKGAGNSLQFRLEPQLWECRGAIVYVGVQGLESIEYIK